jgi:hypothetical protein
MLTFFPREGMFSALYLSLPGGQGVCILYARVVFALSTTKKKVIFVVIRTFLRIDLSVCARRVSLMMLMSKTCAETCANEPSHS